MFVLQVISIKLIKKSQEKNFVYILRLLAGKFVPVCAEFPLATFPAKNFNKASYKNSRQNIIKQHPVQKELKYIKSQIIPENTSVFHLIF